jgi:lactoylglutathione lyase
MTGNCLMVFVADVAATVRFYEEAFGAERDHVDSDGSYGEVRVGEIRIGFVANWHAESHLPIPFQPNELARPPAGFSIYAEVADLDAALDRAKAAGAEVLIEPERKPWGQRQADVRDPNGVLVELASKPGA